MIIKGEVCTTAAGCDSLVGEYALCVLMKCRGVAERGDEGDDEET